MGDYTNLVRVNRTNEEWVGFLIMNKINNEKLTAEERECIINYLLSTTDHTTVRVLELLGLVEVQGSLNVTIEQIKAFRVNMVHKMQLQYTDVIADDNIFKAGLRPINKEIRKYLKFWDPSELENEILITETFEQTMKHLSDSLSGKPMQNLTLSPKLLDCQGEVVCKKTLVDFRIPSEK